MELACRNSEGFEYLSVSIHAFGPPFELVQTGDSYILVAYVPGFRKEDIKVQITDNAEVLTVSGEKVLRELIRKRRAWHQLERSVGRGFSRAFRVPCNVNMNAITARFHDHILYVVMPKITLAIQCEESLENSVCIEDHSNPIDTNSCPQDQLPSTRDQQDEVQPVFEKPSSCISDEKNCSYHPEDFNLRYRDLPTEADDVDDKREAQDASPISHEISTIQDSIQEKNDYCGEKDELESGFDSGGFFSRRTTVLLSMGVASLAIFAAHKLISRRK